jgi:hypothetical protein
VLNDRTHNAYNNFRASSEERARFSLAGTPKRFEEICIFAQLLFGCKTQNILAGNVATAPIPW